LVIFLPAILLYPCLSFLLFEPDEGRYAEIPREMLVRGDWIVPYLQGEPYLDKPPLFYWCVMASYRIFGVHDWSARIVPALAVHLSIIFIYLFGRRVVGERAAFLGSLALGLAPGFLTVGRLLLMDGLLTLWTTLGLLAAFEAIRNAPLRWSWWVVAAFAVGLGVLTKGPIAIVLVVVPVIAYARLAGLKGSVGWRGWFAFGLVVLGVSLPWYVLVSLRLPEFAGYFLVKHNLLRFLSPFDHIEPVWFYVPLIIGGFLPASLLGIAWVRFLISGRAEDAAKRMAGSGFYLLAAAWCVAFFSLSGSKLPTYILPAFPMLALAFGCFLANSHWAYSRLTKGVAAFTVGLLLVAHYAVIPWYADFHSPMSRAQVVADYCEGTPVVCYPRNCDSAAFYLGRDDLHSFRSKETPKLVEHVRRQPRTVVLFTHRHSPEGLGLVLEASGMKLTNLTPISRSWVSWLKEGYCYMGVIENPSPVVRR
jgi:4-amino-4-deoxy-L-arabinose transferase-like glycosyltransferase